MNWLWSHPLLRGSLSLPTFFFSIPVIHTFCPITTRTYVQKPAASICTRENAGAVAAKPHAKGPDGILVQKYT